MATGLEAEDFAAALLPEGRALLAAQDDGYWPVSVRAVSPFDLLASIWFTFPDRGPNARQGFAVAKLALERSPASPGRPTTKTFDEAVSSLLSALG
ncbi:MAG: hypothetical protein ACRDOG_00385 [Gaiellaceae bacterium]